MKIDSLFLRILLKTLMTVLIVSLPFAGVGLGISFLIVSWKLPFFVKILFLGTFCLLAVLSVQWVYKGPVSKLIR